MRNPGGLVCGLFARWGWRPGPDAWSIPCLDQAGHRASITVAIARGGVVVTSSAPGPWLIHPLRVGRLRAALRDAALTVAAMDERPRAG
ncbi:hypothetical protein [Actinokineospora cianjurensis]|uniref:Uncharacterized protein n=1 Tax=Actinokineospora cianjurensis TaxID=585224 RepID=A0A421AX13_9PSEU|nr:hypothetical protein [Actinokineospora cianjurensis]RLK54348.1 hypothetical protein CLV68_5898 [Actinokineospora cianjurensis]